jgi:hypothetical protein
MGLKEAVFFFVGSSTFLLLLFWFMKYMVTVLTCLIGTACATCFSILFEEFFKRVLRAKEGQSLMSLIGVPLVGKVTFLQIIGFVCGTVVVGSWYLTDNWVLSNLMALSLCLVFLKSMEMTSLPPALLLLTLLFFYDIFWVFITPMFTKGGTSVMMYVATNLDLPIKLLMPHITIDYPSSNCSLIGLGDIIIPGIYISYVSRFGFEVALSKVYFISHMIAYLLSLFACGSALWIYGVGQPALLYIVPALFLATFLVAWSRGELKQIYHGNSTESPIKSKNSDDLSDNGYKPPQNDN